MKTSSKLIGLRTTIAGRAWEIDLGHAYDLSIPLAFDAPQPNFFDAPAASARALSAGAFIGDVRESGSCNCSTYTITPHCNGTHTEGVGHVTRERIAIRDVAPVAFALARLVSVTPVEAAVTEEQTEPKPQPGDRLITAAALEAAASDVPWNECTALVVRTLPNQAGKRFDRYGPDRLAAYFSADAMRWVVAHDIRHLIVDLPSVDRAADEGRLTAHRIFWGLPPGATGASQATRPDATITELAYVDDAIADGLYALTLQIAPFQADAAPSRPILLPLKPA